MLLYVIFFVCVYFIILCCVFVLCSVKVFYSLETGAYLPLICFTCRGRPRCPPQNPDESEGLSRIPACVDRAEALNPSVHTHLRPLSPASHPLIWSSGGRYDRFCSCLHLFSLIQTRALTARRRFHSLGEFSQFTERLNASPPRLYGLHRIIATLGCGLFYSKLKMFLFKWLKREIKRDSNESVNT